MPAPRMSIFSFLSPTAKVTRTELASAMCWSVTFVAGALWMTQPSKEWFKTTLFGNPESQEQEQPATS